MKKIICLVLFCLCLCSCASTQSYRSNLDLLSSSAQTRIALSTAPFYYDDQGTLQLTDTDYDLGFLILETTLQELYDKGYAPFFIRKSQGIYNEAEVHFISQIFFNDIIKNQCRQEESWPAVDLGSLSREKANYILFPAFVYKKGNMVAKIFQSPGAVEANFYLFLVDVQSKKIIWNSHQSMVCNYESIKMNVRGFRWGGGTMQQMLKNFPKLPEGQ